MIKITDDDKKDKKQTIKTVSKEVKDLKEALLRLSKVEKTNIVHTQMMPRITNAIETVSAKIERMDTQQIEIMKEQKKMGSFLGNLQGQIEQLKQGKANMPK